MRDLLAETRLAREQLIVPLFVTAGRGVRTKIDSMPGQVRYSVDEAVEHVRRLADLGLQAVLLFGIPETKDATGSAAWDDAAPVQRLCAEIRRNVPDMLVLTDVCLCEYTSHGHCGVPARRADGTTDVDNDATLALLARTAVSHARCGADVVAPSAMMDGQVGAIREALDADGFADTAILSYAVKFASALYGPFRDAAGSAPGEGDRRGYQMDPRAARQAIAEARMDLDEGADMLMVKPAGAYMDVIAEVRRRFDAPLAAYHVSGEYAAVKAAEAAGWLDGRAAALEILTGIRRAGADAIVTYFAEDIAELL